MAAPAQRCDMALTTIWTLSARSSWPLGQLRVALRRVSGINARGMLRVTRRTFLVGASSALGLAVIRTPAWAGVPRSPFDSILGESPAIAALRDSARELLGRLAGRRALPPVLIVGETGSGKGLLGEVLHRAGPRRGKPFIPVHAAAIPETLLESEFLGWEAPALGRAGTARPGLLRAAHEGTVLLAEVDLLPPDFAITLLETIRSGTVRRVNGARDEPADIWLVTTLSCDVDVLAPLRRVVLEMPPLRERGDDVLLLAEHYLARYSRDYGRPAPTLSRRARAALRAYQWPGNVRELMNVMERVVILPEDRIEDLL